METSFISEKYGVRKELTIGQKVQCVYYHEYKNEKKSYRRTFLSKIIDKPFKPVKLGVIIGDAGTHPYWLGSNGKEQYLFVKFKEYLLPKPIPVSCIKDALEAAKTTIAMIQRDMDKIGQKGYSEDSYLWLENEANKALSFVK